MFSVFRACRELSGTNRFFFSPDNKGGPQDYDNEIEQNYAIYSLFFALLVDLLTTPTKALFAENEEPDRDVINNP